MFRSDVGSASRLFGLSHGAETSVKNEDSGMRTTQHSANRPVHRMVLQFPIMQGSGLSDRLHGGEVAQRG
jgi:hypothetical protein